MFCLPISSEKHLPRRTSYTNNAHFLLWPIAPPRPIVLLPLVLTFSAFSISCRAEYYLLRFTHLILRFSYLNLGVLSSQYQRTPSSIIAKYLILATNKHIQKNTPLYASALSPFFLQGFRGFTEAGSGFHLMRGKQQFPATNLSLEMYYCVNSVQVFIIHPGGEDHRQLLHRRFLPQQSTFLLISRWHQIIVKIHLSIYITSQYSRTFRRL